MQFQVTDLDYKKLKPILEANGFGLVESIDPYDPDVATQVAIWTGRDPDGVGHGFACGVVTRDFGHFPKYTLTLADSRLDRTRIHGLMTDLLNAFVRG
jgi:hypothetical protein